MKPLFQTDKVVTHDAVTTLDAIVAPSSANLPAVAPTTALTVKPPRVTEDQIEKIGASSGKGLAAISSKLLGDVRTSNTQEFGKDLNSLVVAAKGLDPAVLNKKGFLGRIMGAASNAKERFIANYATVERQIQALTVELEKKAVHHRMRITDMEQLYNDNVAYHQGLEQAVAQCEQLLVQLRADLEEQKQIAVHDSFGAQRLADHTRVINRAEKRVDDLKRAMLLSKQAAPQIRLMQDNARGLVQKFGDIQTVTLPAWTNAFSLYVLQLEQKEAVELINKVDQTTDDALRRSADLLRENTAMIAEAGQRSLVTVETLDYVQTQLMGSVEDVHRIEAEGKARREQEAPKILEMERALIASFAPKG